MDLISGIVTVIATLGGVIVAVLSLYFTYRDRRASHRHFLYEQQTQAALAIAQKLREIHNQILDLTIPQSADGVISSAARAALLDLLTSSLKQWMVTVFPHKLLLPSFVDDAVNDYFDSILRLSSEDDPPTLDDLTDAFLFALDELRRSLGVEPLSTETLRLLGAPAQPRPRSTTPTTTSSIKVKWKGRINPAAPDT